MNASHATSGWQSRARMKTGELGDVLRACSGAFLSVAIFSALVNILMLTGAIFMLEVYDRVLPSRSVATLLALGMLAMLLFSAQIILDIVRNRILVRIANIFHQSIAPKAFDSLVRLPLLSGPNAARREPLQDLDVIRTFLSGPAPMVLFDLPWLPIYLAVIFALHPLLGWTAFAGAVVLVMLTLLTEVATRRPALASASAAKSRKRIADDVRRNRESVFAMGMLARVAAQWQDVNRDHLLHQRRTSDVAGGLGSIAKGLRLFLQSAVLAVGAYLVIHQEASAGVIIASAILANRALAPVDQAIGQWRNFVSARHCWKRLDETLRQAPVSEPPFVLPRPSRTLVAAGVTACPPGGTTATVRNVSFELIRGQGLGIVGPSGSGKSSLIRTLVGVWQPVHGRVMLDGASLGQWSSDELGRHIGYVPQTVSLLGGSIADNIARFDPAATTDKTIAAARAAGVHELIVALPDGYATQVGSNGEALSVGQRQRVALARALYGEPFLVVLDEPNSNLDAEGEEALLKAIEKVRRRGGIVVLVAHRRSVLCAVDTLLAMNNGVVVASGERDAVIAEFQNKKVPPPRRIRMVEGQPS